MWPGALAYASRHRIGGRSIEALCGYSTPNPIQRPAARERGSIARAVSVASLAALLGGPLPPREAVRHRSRIQRRADRRGRRGRARGLGGDRRAGRRTRRRRRRARGAVRAAVAAYEKTAVARCGCSPSGREPRRRRAAVPADRRRVSRALRVARVVALARDASARPRADRGRRRLRSRRGAGAETVADMGTHSGAPLVRSRRRECDFATSGRIARSEARSELERRRARSPRQLADELARRYGHDFDQPWYIGAIALIARIRLGDLDDVRRLVEPYVDGTKNSLAQPNSLVMAGHIVFTELARRTGDPRYVAAVRKVADLGFELGGRCSKRCRTTTSSATRYSWARPSSRRPARLTGERKYFDMADRHLRFMERLDLRAGRSVPPPARDRRGLGPRQRVRGARPRVDARGAAARHGRLLARATELSRPDGGAAALAERATGLWRNVDRSPGAYAEFSATAMIGFAMSRGPAERLALAAATTSRRSTARG